MPIYFGGKKIVGDIDQVLPHSKIHATTGSDPLTPESIGAANVQHTHNYANVPIVQTVELPVSGWTTYEFGCIQTIAVENMRGSSLIIVSSHPDCYDTYVSARVRCTVQGWGALTFASKTLPDLDLKVNVMILG